MFGEFAAFHGVCNAHFPLSSVTSRMLAILKDLKAREMLRLFFECSANNVCSEFC